MIADTAAMPADEMYMVLELGVILAAWMLPAMLYHLLCLFLIIVEMLFGEMSWYHALIQWEKFSGSTR